MNLPPPGWLTEAEAFQRLTDRGCEIRMPVIRSGTGTYWYRKAEGTPSGTGARSPPPRRGFLFPLPNPTTGFYSEKVIDDLIVRLKL